MDIRISNYKSEDKDDVFTLYKSLPKFFTSRALSIIENDIENLYSFVARDSENKILGSLVVVREAHGDKVYELKWLAIRKTTSGIKDISTFKKLVNHAEVFFEKKARIFILYTSNTANEKKTRRLFNILGYTKCAVIPDFWDDGDDRVVFLKKNPLYIKKS